MGRSLKIGVLALQGAFAKHLEMLRSLGVQAKEVRRPEELADCDGLIIPGGESTTMLKQMRFIKLEQAFLDFAKNRPVFGTCAGLILMSSQVIADSMQPFHLLDIFVERNAFGRQVESFIAKLEVNLDSTHSHDLSAVFIRAPRIKAHGKEVEVLATFEQEPVLVRQGLYLGATFHPELTPDPSVHLYFLKMI